MAEAPRGSRSRYRRRPQRTQQRKPAKNDELKLCTAYLYRKDGCSRGETCNNVHMCRYYILNNCRARTCKFSHDLSSQQSQTLMQRRFGVENLIKGAMLQKFRRLFAATIRNPPKDDDLSKEEIEENKKHCQEQLMEFLFSFASEDESLTEENDINDDDDDDDDDYEDDDDDLVEDSPNPDRRATNTQPRKKNQPHKICSFFLRGNCKFSPHHPGFRHCSTPFQWQIRSHPSTDWLDFTREANEDVEEKFCDVNNTEFRGPILACDGSNNGRFFVIQLTFGVDDFAVTSKNCQTLQARRLSTFSSAQALGWLKVHSTHWIWYWLDDDENWVKYPKSEDASITSSLLIERKYLSYKNQKGSPLFDVKTRMGECRINFDLMQQECSISGRVYVHPVSRRPRKYNALQKTEQKSDKGALQIEQPPETAQQMDVGQPATRKKTKKIDSTSRQDADAEAIARHQADLSQKVDKLIADHSKKQTIQNSRPKPPDTQDPLLLREPPKSPKAEMGSRQLTETDLMWKYDNMYATSRRQNKELGVSDWLQAEKVVQPKSRDRSSLSEPHTSSPTQPSAAKTSDSQSTRTPRNQREIIYICPYFLRGRCKYDDDEYNHKRHFKSPYQWQFLNTRSQDSEWQNIPSPENDTVEQAFCKPDVLDIVLSSQYGLVDKRYSGVFFKETPMCTSYMHPDIHIRRLATSSSVLQSNWEKAFSTEWIWYWQDERDKWIMYSEQNMKGTKAGIDSAVIEQKYLDYERNPGDSSLEFTAGNQTYKLDFEEMTQTNVSYRTVRKVQRRPKFVPMEDRKRLSRELSQAQSSDGNIPPTWNAFMSTDNNLKLVTMTEYGNPEYINVANLFWDKMDNKGSLVSIQRIQNKELWEDFSRMKERMAKRNSGVAVYQKQLFHGTTSKQLAEAICHQNFDWRLSGSNVGAVYGKGSYFAREASFANSYTKSDTNGHRYVFVAQVLVGSFTTGRLEYSRPPPKGHTTSLDLYDSCVNDVSNPGIYVIFEKGQMYPEYLITYKEKSSNQTPPRAAYAPAASVYTPAAAYAPAATAYRPAATAYRPAAAAYRPAAASYTPAAAGYTRVAAASPRTPAPAAPAAQQTGNTYASRSAQYSATPPSNPPNQGPHSGASGTKNKSCSIQ